MKHFLFLIIASILLLSSLSSCEKDENIIDGPVSGSEMKAASAYVESMVSPKFGKPNSTRYYFKVQGTNSLALSVKLYARTSGLVTYIPMSYSGGYWTLSTKIMTNDWYDWRYVYTIGQTNISDTAYVLCNTYNTFDATGTSHIRWPFGADGSSWSNRTININGVDQSWISGIEDGKDYGGYGWNEGTHRNADEQYAVDWNRGIGNQDLGAELRSPFDGEVYATGTYNTSYGPSKYVSVVQTASDGTVYRFFFGHMKTTTITAGTKVRAGVTKLGTLGMSGASSPHAHCSMRNHATNTSVKFEFDAQ